MRTEITFTLRRKNGGYRTSSLGSLAVPDPLRAYLCERCIWLRQTTVLVVGHFLWSGWRLTKISLSKKILKSCNSPSNLFFEYFWHC